MNARSSLFLLDYCNEILSINVGSSSGARELFTRLDTGHRCNKSRVRTRHRLVVDVLLAIGVPVEAAEADAEGIEHYVSQTTLKAFARFFAVVNLSFRLNSLYRTPGD